MCDKAKILVADDEETVRLAYRRSLTASDWHVETAPDGNQALQLMEQGPADVVLLDLRMPGMDGIAVLRTIKQRWPDSEVIIITGYPTLESAKEAVALGAYDYLAKPVGADDVVNAAGAAMLRKKWALRRDERTFPN